jgi:subtilisin family serine protease
MVERGALPPAALSPTAAPGNPGRATVSVRVAGGAARLRGLGFPAREAAGEIAFVDVGRDELRALRALPGLRSIERTQRLLPTLDHSVPLTTADVARRTLGLDGRGALVAIVDTGADYRHADLRDATGRTRITALLDLAHARGGLHPELPPYGGGALWLAADIDAQLEADAAGMSPRVPVLAADVDGHGTHVAGIAASSGRATAGALPAGRYVGMAPGAGLVIAGAARDGSSFGEEDVLTAIRFVVDTATLAGRPVSCNLSLGGDSGPHDGSTAFEQALAALLPPDRPGRALVVSAGNSGSRDRHAGDLSLDGEATLQATFPADASSDLPLSIELWASGGLPQLTVTSPGGVSHGPVAPGGTLDETGDEGRVRIDSATAAADPINGRFEAGVHVTGASGKAAAKGTWRVTLRGRTGRWDAWITDGGFAADPRFVDHLDPDVRGDFPAYSPAAISVGSYVSRSGWLTAGGLPVDRGTTVGAPSTFTATGPTADGRFFPDLSAPGDFVLSALSTAAPPTSPGSSFYVPGDPGYLVGDDGLHGALRGTSQAAPHVTGAIALLFQLDPTLSGNRLRELLRTSARLDAGEPGWSNRFGFGRLDVAAAAALLTRRPAGALDPVRSSIGVSRDAVRAGERVVVTVVPRDSAGAALGPGHAVRITADLADFDGPELTLDDGRVERLLLADAPSRTAVTVGATIDGQALAAARVVWIVAHRQDVGRPFVASSGACGLAGPPGPAPRIGTALGGPGAAALLVLAVLWRRRRGGARPPSA